MNVSFGRIMTHKENIGFHFKVILQTVYVNNLQLNCLRCIYSIWLCIRIDQRNGHFDLTSNSWIHWHDHLDDNREEKCVDNRKVSVVRIAIAWGSKILFWTFLIKTIELRQHMWAEQNGQRKIYLNLSSTRYIHMRRLSV